MPPDPSLAVLAAAVDDLTLPADGRVLADALATVSSAESRLVEGLIAFDQAGLWGVEGDGHRSLSHWLQLKGRRTKADADRLARLVRLCGRAPATLAAWRAGTLSAGHVEAVAGAVSRRVLPIWAEQESALIGPLAELTVAHAQMAMRHWAARARHAAGIDPPDPSRDRSCHLDATLDGTGRLVANLTGEGHAIVAAALRQAEGSPVAGDERTASQRRHDALVEISESYLDHAKRGSHSHHRPHINVMVDREVLRSGVGSAIDLGSGATLTGADVRRLACDANLHRVYRSGSTVLDYGRATRSIPAPLFTAVSLRDGGCRFPGCDRSPGESRGHHVQFWEDDGPTDQQNLMLCQYVPSLLHG